MEKARKQVLLVEDDEDTRETVTELLELLGHEVTPVATGAAAVAAVLMRDFDVAFVDLGLPDISGHEVAVRLRAIAPPRLRIVALSGRSQPSDIARSFASGMDLHLVKPAGSEDLARVVGDASRAPQTVISRTIAEDCGRSKASSSSTMSACSADTKAWTGPRVCLQRTSPT